MTKRSIVAGRVYVPDYASRQVISGGYCTYYKVPKQREGKKDKSSTCEALPARSELIGAVG